MDTDEENTIVSSQQLMKLILLISAPPEHSKERTVQHPSPSAKLQQVNDRKATNNALRRQF
ncbi:hypothetical protein SARC_05533 [Sphaeroforma arctica JP610]|uniref:Uncharacterized protein n=1 Tax=Sphaeroforma arctica JP610 TaxID=667725 RepID=A0A0L0FZD0_9EUKA|nr:hypothetical protein SARC_05533 [Sphaeroforma arctica JP610]KNC82175.1 hypothetical protein SARC_05533 [Sphaeroforma arctica JP610]|eukprot:XP_014156077.1 hypothetical protein SARC_05533 [Sphaeroforma arctica JP610]